MRTKLNLLDGVEIVALDNKDDHISNSILFINKI